jgi:iron-sulfur cluster assembly accessory protein
MQPAAAVRRIAGVERARRGAINRHEQPAFPQLTSTALALNYRLDGVAIGGFAVCGKVLPEPSLDPNMDAPSDINVIVTQRAAARIGEILRQEPPGTMLRVSVEGGGCSGFQYKFDTERDRAADDIAIEREGATVLIDPVSLTYMAGSEIDFVDDLIGSSFKVNNPKATASCGCGTSFAL